MSRLSLLSCLLLSLSGEAAVASGLSCSATMTDLEFGTISIRAGAKNQTSGTLEVHCNGAAPSSAPSSVVGICVTLGPGSGGAAAGMVPRYMKDSGGAQLPYTLSQSSDDTVVNQIFLSVSLRAAGSSNGPSNGVASTKIYGRIPTLNVSINPGSYQSSFSGAMAATLQYGVTECGLAGQTGTVSDFGVHANVTPSCEVDPASLDFGSLPHHVTSPVDATTRLYVRCTKDTSFSISLGYGRSSGVTDPEHRKMQSSLGRLDYGLYQDRNRTVPWGKQPGSRMSSTGIGNTQTFTVYGRVHPGQSLPAGTYSDTVVVTVNY